ncbi:Wall-associated receptor kinase [Thalictrum thalictroides]|uniref:Wall-associated receptor kinase n=1 Tax=Thalictrum thalictroides TaxID=46969 RepID=A0A7J6W1J1_THATH|nr:Wall-associated receptor kinase [Thalictrum thalictroides]
MPRKLLLLFLLLWLLFELAAAIKQLPGCQAKCGNIDIPHPFGIGTGCSYIPSFSVTCNTTFNPPKAFIGDLEVVHISKWELRIKNVIGRNCYDRSGALTTAIPSHINLTGTQFTFSSTKNKVTVLGCDAVGLIGSTGLEEFSYTGGCASVCDRVENVIDGSCSGEGCCQTSIPKGLKVFNATVGTLNNNSRVQPFDHCNSAFLGDQDMYRFKVSDLSTTSSLEDVPVVLNFAFGLQSCLNNTSGICKDNSECYEPDNGVGGLLCNCTNGYEGSPYLNQGCEDVNECEDAINNPCTDNCTNTVGSYHCSCPAGTYGDGRKDGNGCSPRSDGLPLLQIMLGLGFGLLFLVAGGSWLYWSLKKRKLIKLKEKYFEENGGLLLKQRISSFEGGFESTKIFTTEELKLATNNYDKKRILGQGGFGTVYKGILPDLKVVAIKKSKIADKNQLGQFINEVVILTNINHRNVVKLIGCCLETEVPLLVYEFVSNGNLYHHLHKIDGMATSISWKDRLRIASETAGALAYLHSAASIPIIHRDVKSANILLDHNYTAKVADFGASRMNPSDKTQISTLVQGTLGYLDPEYLHTSQLTEKSDVYSFGVVLAELLTGEKALSFKRSQKQTNLATYFVQSMKENNLSQLLQVGELNETEMEQVEAVAELTKRCLNLKGDDRPSMKEIAAELEGCRGFDRHPWLIQISNEEENMSLNTKQVDGASGQYSMQNEMMLSMNFPR